MKRITGVFLSILMLLSLFSLTGCKKDNEALKLGFGCHSYIVDAKNADEENSGGGEASTTVAAVLLDKNGKIIKCAIDSIESDLSFSSNGKFEEIRDLKSKYELGNDYGMKAYGGAKKEWFEQVDAFISVVLDKNITEIKALKGENKKGNDAVISAGCTIEISDFILAIEKAVNSAKDSSATSEDNLRIGMISKQTTNSLDASEEADGTNEIETTIAAVALDNKGKITAAAVDAVVANLKFDTKGVIKSEYGVVIATKQDSGEKYGMSAHGEDRNGDGEVKEWFEQANIFAATLIDKHANEIEALEANDGYGDSDLQNAGCTIKVNDMVKSAIKAATVK